MQIEKEFTLLKIEAKERHGNDNTVSTYLVINVLDVNLNPCTFFVFKGDLVKSILDEMEKVKALTKVLIDFDLNYTGKLWNCNVNTVLFNY